MPLPSFLRHAVDEKLRKFCDHALPSNAFDEIVKLHYEVRGNDVILLESRAHSLLPAEDPRYRVARFRYNPKDGVWSLYYVDRNEKWQEYMDILPSPSLDDLLKEVQEDPTGIFWG
jgi:hypothetical protein